MGIRVLQLQHVADSIANEVHRRGAAALSADCSLNRIVDDIQSCMKQRVPPDICDDTGTAGMAPRKNSGVAGTCLRHGVPILGIREDSALIQQPANSTFIE